MAMTTIRVSQRTHDRLRRLADSDGLTLAQEIEKLLDRNSPRPKPTIGGFRSGNPLSSEEINEALAATD